MDEKFIYQENNQFLVKNFVGSECVTFGSFNTIDEAIEFRDEMEDYGWPYSKPTSHSITKIESNIFEEDGIFSVSKEILDFEIIFGRFNSLERAQSFKHKLIENAWNMNFSIRPFKYGRYIRKDSNFIVNRTIDGKYFNYGSYKFLDEAISRRDELIDTNWEMSDESILSNLGIIELSGLHHNIGKVGRKYLVFKWEGMKCIFLALLPNLSLAIKFRDKLDSNKKSSDSELGKYYFDTQYINLVGDVFRVAKMIDGNLKTFGHYRTLDQAIEIRNKLMDNNWDDSIIDLSRVDRIRREKNRYIHKHNDGFTIFKRINGELINFGFFENFDDAVEYRNILEENNWVLDEDDDIEEKFDEYIYVKSDGKFYLMNEINGEMRIFGIFDEPLDAIAARLDCIRANWDLPSMPENEQVNSIEDNFSESQIIDDFSEDDFYEEIFSKSIKFPVTVGKSYKNKGWAIKRSYLLDLVPILSYEHFFTVLLNGIEVNGKLNVHTRLFYKKNEELINYLKKLYDIDPKTQTRIDFILNYGSYQKVPDISGKSLSFTAKFSKSLQNGLFAIPRSISKYIFPILPYEDSCNFSINNIDVEGKFNLEFRFKFSNQFAIEQLKSQLDDGDDLEVILKL